MAGRLVRVLAAMYAIAALVAVVAWWTVGDAGWLQPVTLTTFWWSLPAVVLCLLALLLGSRRTAALLAVPALVWVWSYGGAFVPTAERGPADLRVMSFNTYVRAPDHQHVLDLLSRHEPDVVLLQEVFPDREQALVTALAETHPHRAVTQSPGVGGVAVFSRFPLQSRPLAVVSENSRGTALVTVDLEGRTIQVVSIHLISPCPSCGVSLLKRAELEGDVRRAEMTSVIGALDPDLPAIVGGDFNSSDRSGPYRLLTDAGFRDPQREAGNGMGFTWPDDRGPFPLLRIDWVMTRGLEPVHAFVDQGGPSDHRPVVVDLALPDV